MTHDASEKSLGAAPPASALASELGAIVDGVRSSYAIGRRVMSFQEYLAMFGEDPARHGRDASRYLRDAFDYYGTETVAGPSGDATRYRLFDLPFAEPATRRERLIGQEDVQGEIYRILSNFAREGRPNKLILLHGPNGSSKSTIASCITRALEHYSTVDDGALYRFNWVFPSAKTGKGRIGFRDPPAATTEAPAPTTTPRDDSYAHLEEDLVDARLISEIRDHPLFLIPPDARRALLDRAWAGRALTEPPSDWLLRGRLSQKNQQVYEALLNGYRGDLAQVLRHVSVERYFISRRYRVGAVTVGPQMSVDAGERQITADRSLAALPATLQAVALFEAFGELVDAAGGVLEFSDLLKRPLDAYKYLQLTVETGEVALSHQNVQLNTVLIGSANEVHLHALREHPEWASFRGRLELVKTPYLRSYVLEQQIYDTQIAPQVRRHVAPHATYVAALFAVLTRMRKLSAEHYDKSIGAAAASLTAIEKADLYAKGVAPERLEPDQQKLLRAAVAKIDAQGRAFPIYEGRVGASPREIKGVLLDAAQHPRFSCLSPLAVLDELEDLSARTSEYEWLQQEVLAGGYHDVKHFREHARTRVVDFWEDALRTASGLVEERSYLELFDRYVKNVSAFIKTEKLRNPVTGAYEEPDANLMGQVEKLLGQKGDALEFRRGMMSAFAAWSIDHPGEKLENERVFPQHMKKLKESSFESRKKAIADLCRQLVVLIEDDGKSLDLNQRRSAEAALERLIGQGYCRFCARDAAAGLLRWRYA
jgi:serine protein kinase